MDGIGLFHSFLQAHQPQLQSSGVPRRFWEILHKKLKNHIFDAGLVFQLGRLWTSEDDSPRELIWKLFVSAENGISANDSNNIYLVDHAWTYDIAHAKQNLLLIPDLLNRMCCLMGFNMEEEDEEKKIEFVINEMWRYNQAFSLSNGSLEDRLPVWYIMDELGSAINHSDDPNFRTVPFLYLPEGVTYTLLFPIKDVEFEEEVTRDFVEGQTNDPEKRRALLLPWVDSSFEDESFVQKEPDESYFLAGRIRESLPEEINPETIRRNKGEKLKVFSQYSYVNEYLTDPAFEVVENEEDADILWYTSHFKEYKELSLRSPRVFVNQFPFENIITVRDLFPIVCRRKAKEVPYNPDTVETYPLWLPTTYNLSTELVQFVAYFQRRASMGLDNHWICKPGNLMEGLDKHITNNLLYILRLPSTGPKIAQKYISQPVLYKRPYVGEVKFDVRYIIMLKSVKPLKAYVYKNFFLRFAETEFALKDSSSLYEQHFTAMDDPENIPQRDINCSDFMLEWEIQYPEYPWKEYVEPKIFRIFKEVFEAAVSEKPPKGIAESTQSRAVYTTDLMLEWKKGEMQPMLLKINFSPDCQKACEYYPTFYNDIFKCLFMDIDNPAVFHDLCRS